MSKPISCSNYDYFEIACTLKLSVELTLRNDEKIRGEASTLRISRCQNDTIEQILLVNPDTAINLTEIKKMKSLDSNPHFEEIIFP